MRSVLLILNASLASIYCILLFFSKFRSGSCFLYHISVSLSHTFGCFNSEPAAFKRVSRLEGIIPALETSHALAYLEKLCPTLPNGAKVVVNCSGRGDKDVQTALKYLKV